MSAKRITEAKLKRAADLAKEKGVRVTLGDYVIEPTAGGGVTISNDDADEAAKIQQRFDETRGR